MLVRQDQVQTELAATIQYFASVLRDEVAEFVDEYKKRRSLLGPATKGGGHQLVHEQRSQKMLIVLRNGILLGEIYKENLSVTQDPGKVQRFCVLAQNGADDFVLDKRLDAVERGLDSLLTFIDLHALQPIPLRPDAWIGDASADGCAHRTGAGVHQVLGLDERETGRNQGISDVEKPARQSGNLLERSLAKAFANGFHQRDNLVRHDASIPGNGIEPNHPSRFGHIKGHDAAMELQLWFLNRQPGAEAQNAAIEIDRKSVVHG